MKLNLIAFLRLLEKNGINDQKTIHVYRGDLRTKSLNYIVYTYTQVHQLTYPLYFFSFSRWHVNLYIVAHIRTRRKPRPSKSSATFNRAPQRERLDSNYRVYSLRLMYNILSIKERSHQKKIVPTGVVYSWQILLRKYECS